MFDGMMILLMHDFVSLLLSPTILALGFMMLLAVWETGLAIGERFWGLRNLPVEMDERHFASTARRRLGRTDFLMRVSPMLGLMGTLIPLGPGLAGLGQGDLSTLTKAVTVAFDTTVMGLLGGIVGFVLGRLRRRWYDEVLDR